jgi:predicted nucleic acid-binding Zn ribbon protein
MRRKNTQNIADIIKEMLQDNNRLSQGLVETQVIKNWSKVLGPSVERHTTKAYMHKGVLFVHLNSSVVRNELVMLKEKIIRSLNQSVSTNIVTDIVFR